MERTKISLSRDEAIHFLGSSGYLTIDKRIVLLYEPNVALFLGNLIDFYKYLKSSGQLADEWFFCTYDQLRGHINLSDHKMRSCKEILKENKIIQTKIIGMPKREFYYIDFLALITVLKSIESRDQIFQSLEIKKINLLRLKSLTSNIKNKEEIKLKGKSEDLPISLPPKLITKAMFDKFWEIYPKKNDKGKALSKWNTIVTRDNGKTRQTCITIKKAILAQIKSERWSVAEYIPAPTTWLNQSRWLDDPAEMKLFKRDNEKQTPKTTTGYRSSNIVYREPDEIV